MRLFMTWFLLFFIALNLSAQQDSKAKEILDDLSEATQAHETIKADFTSKAVNTSNDMEEEHKGILWQKGEKYKLEFMDAITYFNGESKWVYMPDVNEVNLFSVDETMETDNIFDNPQQIFTIYEEGYKYRYIGEKDFNGSEVLEIELVPENKDLEYYKIKLFVNQNKEEIKGFKYFAKDGTRLTVTIDDFKTDLNYKDSMFTFSEAEHPDAELIDMRE